MLGVQNAVVSNSIFSNTGRGGASIRFDEASWDKLSVTHCNIYNSGRIASFWGRVVKGPVYNFEPAYMAAGSYNFNLKTGSSLVKGTDGKLLGINNAYFILKNIKEL